MRKTWLWAAFLHFSAAWAQNASPPDPFDSSAFYGKTRKPAISSEAMIEFSPTIRADGKTIIYEASTSGKRWSLYESQLSHGSWSEPKPIDKINSTGDSLDLIGGPSLSFDGNTLFFFRTVGIRANPEIFYSTREKDGWSDPVDIGAPVNSEGFEGFPSISADGRTLYFVRQNVNGPASRELRRLQGFCYSIHKSVKDKNGKWGKPEKLPWPINQDCEKAPRIMADGRTLIFSSNRPGGKGLYDMYQTTLNDLDEWSTPVNLDFVNSEFDDQAPCLSAQGDLMYYTHNNKDIYSIVMPFKYRQFLNNIVQGFVTDQDSKAGLGANVIVTDALTSEVIMTMASSSDDGRYTIVLPVGRNFNLEFRKPGFSTISFPLDLRSEKRYKEKDISVELFKTIHLSLSVSDKELFDPLRAKVVVREKNGQPFGRELTTNPKDGRIIVDLPIGRAYEIEVNKEHYKIAKFEIDVSGLVIYRDFEKMVDLDPEKKSVMINVADQNNNSKVKSKVVIKNKTRGEIIEVEGNQMVSLRSGDRYEIEVTSDQGYAFNSTSLDLAKNGANPQINLNLMKLEMNASLTLKEINFESNSTKLSDISFVELERVVKLMFENPGLRVEIAAHTDDRGSDAYNLALSDKRAQSVVDFLIHNRIKPERFEAKGYGESVKKVGNDTDSNRAINRRVELKIIGV